MTDVPSPDRLAALVERLDALTAALAPALTPATRPTWDQLRWAPGPDAFGPGDDLAVAPAPAAAVDPSGNPGYVVTNELIESAWGNAVAGHVVRVYATKAALDAGWTSPPDGAVASVLDSGFLYRRRGAAWIVPYGTGQQGGSINPADASSSIPPGTYAAVLTVNRHAGVGWPGDDRDIQLSGSFDVSSATGAAINGYAVVRSTGGTYALGVHFSNVTGTATAVLSTVVRMKLGWWPLTVDVTVSGGNFKRGEFELTGIDVGPSPA